MSEFYEIVSACLFWIWAGILVLVFMALWAPGDKDDAWAFCVVYMVGSVLLVLAAYALKGLGAFA